MKHLAGDIVANSPSKRPCGSLCGESSNYGQSEIPKGGGHGEGEIEGEGRCRMGNTQEVTYDDALTYLREVKQRFSNQDGAYKSFLKIINMYSTKQDITEVYGEVATFLTDHPDLLVEFEKFLPDGTIPLSAKDVPLIKNDMDGDKSVEKLQKDRKKLVEMEKRDKEKDQG
ncbi:paired amphipathic helix protein Sin3-like 2 [Diospyros lotus]|uniref:paired amphipathic helix protein Sin3-like 2 n=1 Tax=Diospyros lotus TaxID=55363 RepID=UPI00224F063C|nr:paired amphipathic helix protein Sin3-like 2 [Diospyros lotus]XP_052190902.1 paired amphipathic helix protein Sin3-like 2 [Diospyros lotus]